MSEGPRGVSPYTGVASQVQAQPRQAPAKLATQLPDRKALVEAGAQARADSKSASSMAEKLKAAVGLSSIPKEFQSELVTGLKRIADHISDNRTERAEFHRRFADPIVMQLVGSGASHGVARKDVLAALPSLLGKVPATSMGRQVIEEAIQLAAGLEVPLREQLKELAEHIWGNALTPEYSHKRHAHEVVTKLAASGAQFGIAPGDMLAAMLPQLEKMPASPKARAIITGAIQIASQTTQALAEGLKHVANQSAQDAEYLGRKADAVVMKLVWDTSDQHALARVDVLLGMQALLQAMPAPKHVLDLFARSVQSTLDYTNGGAALASIGKDQKHVPSILDKSTPPGAFKHATRGELDKLLTYLRAPTGHDTVQHKKEAASRLQAYVKSSAAQFGMENTAVLEEALSLAREHKGVSPAERSLLLGVIDIQLKQAEFTAQQERLIAQHLNAKSPPKDD